ncbi:MAG: transcriptional regulator [Rhodospirillales bacterium]|jgi:putative transcriptional regulator|nr:transcriptional regulator [Rhodospirillales bacterium]MDP6883504.1 transcriptional regulator [Rhodospirillales bacterium]
MTNPTGNRKVATVKKDGKKSKDYKTKTGQAILEGAREGLAYARGEADESRFAATVVVPVAIDVPAIRRKLGLSQPQFAARYSLSIGTLRDWEQGRRQPDRHARMLLRVIEREPEAVERALTA